MGIAHVRGIDISYRRFGAGVDFVWGHGLTSSMASEDAFGLLDFERIGTAVTALRYDARGHGDTTSTPDAHEYSWANLAQDQFALADEVGIGRYIAGGASMGAATALHAAVANPGRVTGLLLAIPPTAWETRAAQIGQYAVLADLVDAGQVDAIVAGSAQQPSPDPFADTSEWRDRFAHTITTTDPQRLARIFRGAGTADLPEEDAIAALDVPTLILAWTGDAGHPVGTAARLQELMPHAELAVATTRSGLDSWTDRVVRWLASVG